MNPDELGRLLWHLVSGELSARHQAALYLSPLKAIGPAALPYLDQISALAREWRDEELDEEDNPLDQIVKAIVAPVVAATP